MHQTKASGVCVMPLSVAAVKDGNDNGIVMCWISPVMREARDCLCPRHFWRGACLTCYLFLLSPKQVLMQKEFSLERIHPCLRRLDMAKDQSLLDERGGVLIARRGSVVAGQHVRLAENVVDLSLFLSIIIVVLF